MIKPICINECRCPTCWGYLAVIALLLMAFAFFLGLIIGGAL